MNYISLYESLNRKKFISLFEAATPEEKAEMLGVLDQIMSSDSDEMPAEFNDILKPNGPTIYAFITPKVKDAIKIGYTDQHPLKRLEQWKKHYDDAELIGYWSAEEFNNVGKKVFFWDHDVHKKVEKRGYKNIKKEEFNNFISDIVKEPQTLYYSQEFFRKYRDLLSGELDEVEKQELSAELIQDIIFEMKESIKQGKADFNVYEYDENKKSSLVTYFGEPAKYKETELQEECIKAGIQAIKSGKHNLLMAAVMRFGKTHASYEIIRRCGFKKVLVVSGFADVKNAWRDDINHIKYYKDFVFIEPGTSGWKITAYNPETDTLLSVDRKEFATDDVFSMFPNKTVIICTTLQDLTSGGLKEKHRIIYNQEFDIEIVDETHYGSHAETWSKAIDFEGEGEDEDAEALKQDREDIKKLPINAKVVLQVSGTPYYLLTSNEMLDPNAEIISRVSYTDMINARDNWNKLHEGEDKTKSPYFGIPTLNKIGMHLNKECQRELDRLGYTDDISKVFAVSGGKFKYEKAVESLMKSIFGTSDSNSLALLKNKKIEGNKVCKHTMIVMPLIKECIAMENLLKKIGVDREIIRIVDESGNGQIKKTLGDLNIELENLDAAGKKSIILTVKRFLTGASMPLLDSMIYFKNAKNPQEYDQAIYRLCTRNVKEVKGGKGPKKVNMKDNVYLIDFNISNMFNMMANSARMKAIKEGHSSPEDVKKYMEEDLDATPIYCEGGLTGQVLGKMEQIKPNEFLKFYTGYNENKSVVDIVNEDIDKQFKSLFTNSAFQRILNGFNISGDKSKFTPISFKNDNETSLDLSSANNGNVDRHDTDRIMSDKEIVQEITVPEENRELVNKIVNQDYIPTKEEWRSLDRNTKKIIEDVCRNAAEKFKAVVKYLMYANLCLETPMCDMEQIVTSAENGGEIGDILNEFGLDVPQLRLLYEKLKVNRNDVLSSLNNMLTKVNILMTDDLNEENGSRKFIKAMEGLGKIDKSEVVTPPEIVNKMIDKLDESEYKKAESILLVNEKCGEFLIGLRDKFEKEIVDKCKIVPSSEIGKRLIIKLLKTIGVDPYKIIIELSDINADGKTNIRDFLSMSNEEILEQNGGKKFDIILSNPPYDKSLHLKFLEKYIQIANNIVSIQPVRWLEETVAKYKKNSAFNKYENSIAKHISDLEILNQLEAEKMFSDVGLTIRLAIYYCNEKGGYDYKKLVDNKIIEKVIKQMPASVDEKIKFSIPKNAVVVGLICGGNNGRSSEFHYWFDINSPLNKFIYDENGKRLDNGLTFEENRKLTAWGNVKVRKEQNNIPFNTIKECKNFIKYTQTKFFNYLFNTTTLDVHVQSKFLPFMNDYTHEWTDKELYKFFNLTKEEIQEVENYSKN